MVSYFETFVLSIVSEVYYDATYPNEDCAMAMSKLEEKIDMVKGLNQLQWTNEFNMKFEEPFELDVIINDADQITIGNKKFLFYSCPGHTAGTLSIFFNTIYNGEE